MRDVVPLRLWLGWGRWPASIHRAGQGRAEGKRPRVLVLTGLRKAGPRPAGPKVQLASPCPEKQLHLPDQPSCTALRTKPHLAISLPFECVIRKSAALTHVCPKPQSARCVLWVKYGPPWVQGSQTDAPQTGSA